MIMKGCVQWNPVYGRKDFRLERGSKPGPLSDLISRPVLNLLSYRGSQIQEWQIDHM